jgi:hypothetical protein
MFANESAILRPRGNSSSRRRGAGNAYWRLLHDHEAIRPQSCRGEGDNNAQAESLRSRFKSEVLCLLEARRKASALNASLIA